MKMLLLFRRRSQTEKEKSCAVTEVNIQKKEVTSVLHAYVCGWGCHTVTAS